MEKVDRGLVRMRDGGYGIRIPRVPPVQIVEVRGVRLVAWLN